MEQHGRIARASAIAAFAVIVLTGCTTEKRAAMNESGLQTEYDAEESSGRESEIRELNQTPKEKDLEKAVDEENRKTAEDQGALENQEQTEEMLYQPLMEAAIEAIEADDAKALYELQESEEAKALEVSVRNGEHYVYFPDGEDSGKGIGYYTFEECSCRQWYYGSYKDGQRDGKGIWYYVSSSTEDGGVYKEVYDGDWKEDAPNGKGRQVIVSGDKTDTSKKLKVKNGLFYGTYKIKDKLEDGTVVRGKYKLKKGRYVTISDEELEANNFEIPEEEHLAIAFLYDEAGKVRSCSMIYAKDIIKGVKHFYDSNK